MKILFTKAVIATGIGVAILAMVVSFVPGIYDGFAGAPQGVYAVVHQRTWWGKLFGENTSIQSTEVANLAGNLAQRQGVSGAAGAIYGAAGTADPAGGSH